MTSHLVDVSSHNRVSDWRAVFADGISAASVKLTQANNYENPRARDQMFGAINAGVAAGGYHFGDPRVPAVNQAHYFKTAGIRHEAFADGRLAPMYDAENWPEGGMFWPDSRTLNAHIAEHIRVVRELTGVRRHLVYASLSWWRNGFIRPDEWADDDVFLWIAVYNGRPGDLQGWNHPRAAIHQHTSAGIVPGIEGNVDKNVTINGFEVADLLIGDDDMGARELAILENLETWLLRGGPDTDRAYDGGELPAGQSETSLAQMIARSDRALREVRDLAGKSLGELLTELAAGQGGEITADQAEVLAAALRKAGYKVSTPAH